MKTLNIRNYRYLFFDVREKKRRSPSGKGMQLWIENEVQNNVRNNAGFEDHFVMVNI
jgi:hypothetical protein